MSNVVLAIQNELTMSTREIAEFAKKQHSHVIRDADKMFECLEKDPSIFGSIYLDNYGREQKQYELPKDLTITLVSGYDIVIRNKIINRWLELEEQSAPPKLNDPVLQAVQVSLIELDRVKTEQAAIKHDIAAVESNVVSIEGKLKEVELQHRNGVPAGYLSKKQAHYKYGTGLSEEIFHLAMAKLSIASQRYVHTTEEGHEVPTTAYKEDEIGTAVDLFLDDAEQVTPKTCESKLLKGKRFRYAKEGK